MPILLLPFFFLFLLSLRLPRIISRGKKRRGEGGFLEKGGGAYPVGAVQHWKPSLQMHYTVALRNTDPFSVGEWPRIHESSNSLCLPIVLSPLRLQCRTWARQTVVLRGESPKEGTGPVKTEGLWALCKELVRLVFEMGFGGGLRPWQSRQHGKTNASYQIENEGETKTQREKGRAVIIKRFSLIIDYVHVNSRVHANTHARANDAHEWHFCLLFVF